MDLIINILTTAGIFILSLFILVLVHELGHFLAAKFFKMRVDRFSIGFPPRLFGKKIGETDYCVSATPLGGYVKIAGMIDESMDTDFINEEPKPWEFRSKPVWQRIIVITAGVIFNVILAAVIYTGVTYHYGETKIPLKNVGSMYIQQNSPAAQMGFKSGDRIVAVNGQHVKYFDQLVNPVRLTKEHLSYTVIRDGKQVTLNAPADFLDKINKGGFISPLDAVPSEIRKVIPGSPADKAGLKSGDKIVAINGKPVNYWIQLVQDLKASKGTLQLSVLRNGEEKTLSVTPDPKTNTIGIYRVNIENYFNVEFVQPNLFKSIEDGVTRTGDTMVGIVQGFIKLFSGSISIRQNLGGPVAIANITKQATEGAGARGFWEITALLSVTLAIMNILPIPVLDGGHLMFLIYEGVTRREPSAKVRMVLQQIGFIFIIGLLIFVTFNDILRTIGN
ncbi:MAG TPA: RIP metalloprotease RseP [Balneolales bacterium]|nr:RIP metalloprotease RseP [Balneolales bacterium]